MELNVKQNLSKENNMSIWKRIDLASILNSYTTL